MSLIEHSPSIVHRLGRLAKNIVQRIGQTRRHESTASGLRTMVALVVLRNKAIKPLLAAAQTPP
jgi:hypothetical protein